MTKKERLLKVLKQYDNIAVAFSGGVDSTLLAKAAYEVHKEKAIAITIHSNMHAAYEIEEAKEFAASIGIKHIVVDLDAFEMSEFVKNDPLRCYHCKKVIFSNIIQIAKDNGIDYIADGSNLDDLSDYRPGMKALEELKVVSPLKEADLTKQDIRDISKDYGLPTWKKAAFACLATRIPTGDIITEDKLRRIEKAETFLMEEGFYQYRVRCHDDLARIEVSKEERHRFYDDEYLEHVHAKLLSFGFRFVSLDMSGYKKGNMNNV
jgi:uncharacterized protein